MSDDRIIRSTDQLLSTMVILIPELQRMFYRLEEINRETNVEIGDVSTSHSRDRMRIFIDRYTDVVSNFAINNLNHLRRNPNTGAPAPLNSNEISRLRIIINRVLEYGFMMIPYISSLIANLMSFCVPTSEPWIYFRRQPLLEYEGSGPTIEIIEDFEE